MMTCETTSSISEHVKYDRDYLNLNIIRILPNDKILPHQLSLKLPIRVSLERIITNMNSTR